MSALTLRKRGAEMPSGCMVLFFLVFAVVGGGIVWFLLVRPMTKVVAARSWPPVSCTVVESRVDESSGDDGSTYKVLVNASFVYDGSEHKAPYDFSGSVYSGGYDDKAAIVARYPVRLDPGAPFGVTNPQGENAHGAIELKPRATPLGKLIGLIFASLIWNGITWTIAWFAVIRSEEREGCVVVFLAVFALIGLLLIYGMFRQFLVLFNPRPRLTLSPGSLKLGEVAYLQWRLTGAAGGVRRLQVTLEGKEEVRYRRGTDTTAETKAFATIPIVDSTDSYQMLSGSTSFAVPSDTLPTFASENNKVIWTIKAQLEIANWPDSDEEFEILVRP